MLNPDSIIISNFHPNHALEIVRISDQQYGKNFITASQLSIWYSDLGFKGYVALINNQVVGFSMIKVCSLTELTDEIFVDKLLIKKTIQNHEPIGHIRQSAVVKEMAGNGIGNKLNEYVLKDLENRVKSIARIIWKKESEPSIERILHRNKFIALKEIPDYWYEDSLKKLYECVICGNPPCKCSAVLYFKIL